MLPDYREGAANDRAKYLLFSAKTLTIFNTKTEKPNQHIISQKSACTLTSIAISRRKSINLT
jgi:hypothetical protein